VGKVSQVSRLDAAYGSTWILEYFIKRPEDYEETIAAHTSQLVEEAGAKRGFAIGITEDIPAQYYTRSLRAIACTMQNVG
jgi:hypothetical protein